MKIIGHRGAAGLAPENTLQAIQKAIEAGVDEIEIDVRVDKTGTPVLSHDPISGRATSLESAIKKAADKCPLIIEIKPGENTGPIFEIIKKYPASTLTIASFDFNILKAARKELPEASLAVLDKWSGIRATRRARKLGTKKIGMNQKWLWSGFIRGLAVSGYDLATYTVNNPRRAKRWEKYGLYAVITDYPDRFK